MDIRTISATLALLGSGLTLGGCNKTQTDATEVPGNAGAAGEKSCKGHGDSDKSCGGHAEGEKSCGGEKGCSGVKGDTTCAASKPTETAATEPAAADPATTATATAPATAEATPTTTKTEKKKKPAAKKTKGEAACGEGTCG